MQPNLNFGARGRTSSYGMLPRRRRGQPADRPRSARVLIRFAPLLSALGFLLAASGAIPPLRAARLDTGPAPHRPARAAQAPLEAYTRIAQWPERQAAAAGTFQEVVSLDVALDGRAYVADAGAGGVHTLLPSGTYLPPFGATGEGPARLGAVGRLAVDQAAERVYVLDTGTRRVVIFDLDGAFVAAWDQVDGAAIAVGPDGRVYLADRERNAVAAYEPSGTLLFRFGGHGTGDGQFTLLADLSVSADGRTLAVGDLNTLRVQLFDLGPGGATFRRAYMLNAPKFSPKSGGPGYNQCRAGTVFSLGGDEVWVGDGGGACRIDPTGFRYVIAGSAGSGTICKQSVRAPRVRLDTGQFFAVADYDPNFGPCYSPRAGKDARLPRTPAVVQYRDLDMHQPLAVHLTGRNAKDDSGLVAPWFVSAPAPGQVLVLDTSRFARFHEPLGPGLGTLGLTTRQTAGITQRMSVERADGTGAAGEIFGYYRLEHRGKAGGGEVDRPTPTPVGGPTPGPREPEAGASWIEDAHGIGRFRSVEVLEYGQPVQVLEPIWTQPFGTPSLERSRDLGSENRTFLQVVDLAYHDPSDFVVTLAYERQPTRKQDDAKLMLTSASGPGRTIEWDLPDDSVTSFTVNPYIDLSVGPDGRIYALDDYRDLVLAFLPDGTRLGDIPVTADLRAIAGGPGGVLFGLREAGYVERYAPDGTVTARFDGRPFASADPLTLSALAVDEQGRVYVADGQSSVVSVFAPAPPDSGVLPVPGDASCALAGTKAADPSRLTLGEAVTVTLGLDGLCGIGEEPSDIVLVTMYHPDLRTPDPAEATIKLLRRLVSRVDYRKHRLGIVGYFRDASIELPLSQDPAKVLGEIQRLPRKWPSTCYVYEFGSNSYAGCYNAAPVLREGIKLAQTAFDPNSPRRKVMLLFQPDYCNRDFEYHDGDCRVYPSAEAAAEQARAAGIQIVVFDGERIGWRRLRLGGPGGAYNADAAPLASSDADVVRSFAQAQHRMVRYRVPEHLASQLRLVDSLPANMPLVPGSPSAGGVASGPDVSWNLPLLGYGPSHFSLAVRPQAVGRWPTNIQAVADYVDGWGQPGRIVFPVPEVEVLAPPTATPIPTATPEPSPTPRPPSATPPPTPTPVLAPIFLPIGLREDCDLPAKPIDVALVLDASVSMAGEKIAAARAAAHAFAGIVALPEDRIAVIAFNEAATSLVGLTGDRAAIDAAIDRIALAPGTRIDAGLATARAELEGPAGRRDATRVVVLLTDGRQESGAEVAQAEAAAARAAGLRIFTVGLGADVDAAFLEDLAGTTGRYYHAPAPQDLAGIYAELAVEARTCPPDGFWGRR